MLQVGTGTDRVLSLASFRGAVRPVLVAGSKSYLAKVAAAAEPYRADLQERAVSLVLLPLDVDDPEAKLKALKQKFRCGRETVGGWDCAIPS